MTLSYTGRMLPSPKLLLYTTGAPGLSLFVTFLLRLSFPYSFIFQQRLLESGVTGVEHIYCVVYPVAPVTRMAVDALVFGQQGEGPQEQLPVCLSAPVWPTTLDTL
jgi:hypothetical protein